MAKLKLSLPSGSEVEKSVISYFKSNGANYLILDAESIGSMGLPIILVCKVVEDKVVKIVDQNEWQQVKSYLKMIISGGKMDYIAAPISLPADEVYYTQLTLPVASFDILKNSYVVESNVVMSNPTVDDNITDVNPVVSQPIETNIEEQPINMATNIPSDEPLKAEINVPDSAPIVNDMIEPVINNQIESNGVLENSMVQNNMVLESPMVNEGLNSSLSDSSPVDSVINEINPEPVAFESNPIMDNQIPESGVDSSVAVNPIMENQEVIANNTVNSENKIDFSDCKTLFMQACENMFDALAAKIEAELKNK